MKASRLVVVWSIDMLLLLAWHIRILGAQHQMRLEHDESRIMSPNPTRQLKAATKC